MNELFVEKYKIAEEHYARAEALIREMATAFKEEKCPDYNVDYNVAQYDIILQAVLLASIAQGADIERSEIKFISNLTKHGDIMVGLNAEIADAGLDYEEITWDDIGRMMSSGKAVASRIIKLLSQLAYNVSESFIEDLAPIDATREQKDFLDALLDETLHIVIALSELDGDTMQDYNPDDDEITDIENEVSVGADLLRKMLSERWLECIARVEQGSPEDTDSDE